MKNSYVNVLIQSLEEKDAALSEIIRLNEAQEDLLKESTVDLKSLESNMDEMSGLVRQVERLNEGFESVYGRVKPELSDNKDQYRDEIKRMQELIQSVTEKSVKIEAAQSRNKAAAEREFGSRRRDLGQRRSNLQKVSRYSNQMNGIPSRKNVDSVFFNQKK